MFTKALILFHICIITLCSVEFTAFNRCLKQAKKKERKKSKEGKEKTFDCEGFKYQIEIRNLIDIKKVQTQEVTMK